MEGLFVLMLRHLSTMRWLGWAVFSVAGAAVGLGLRLGRVFNRATRALSRAGINQDFTLATAYPTWPTWWIPETTEGFIIWVVIGGFGAWVGFAAKSLQKQFG